MDGEKYYIKSEFGDASCKVEFEELEDGYVFLKFSVDSTTLSFDGEDGEYINWERLGEIMHDTETWKDELNYVRKQVNGHNWKIHIYKDDGKGRGVTFHCFAKSGEFEMDLGNLAECYDDCDECTNCHNHSFCYDSQLEKCQDCEGCSFHPCLMVNGREKLAEDLKRIYGDA